MKPSNTAIKVATWISTIGGAIIVLWLFAKPPLEAMAVDWHEARYVGTPAFNSYLHGQWIRDLEDLEEAIEEEDDPGEVDRLERDWKRMMDDFCEQYDDWRCGDRV